MPRPQTLPGQVPTAAGSPETPPHAVVDMDHYAPAYFTWIANKLSRGASQAYLGAFGVGVESWRVLVLLAIEGPTSAQRACAIIGMDKSSMSRCFKGMQARGFITLSLDPGDGRSRIATLTPPGLAMHDQIRNVALVRERAFMAVLDPDERSTLLGLLHRLHANLPAVESATRRHLAQHHPQALQRKATSPARVDGNVAPNEDIPGVPE